MTPYKGLPPGKAIKKFRVEGLQCTQTRLAEMLGVTLSTVAKWESGNVKPSKMAILALAERDFQNKAYWLELAGPLHASVGSLVDAYKQTHSFDPDKVQAIRIHGSAGAGPNRFPSSEAEEQIFLPRSWFKSGQVLIGLHVKGDSMAPLIEDGFLVLVDVHDNQDFASLDGKVVAARDEHGVCIKWLRKKGRSFYLISQNVSAEYPPIEVERDGYAVVGRVVKWIGEPFGERKR
jgi:SOS-response transcriptional repressor LexA